jgi:hypothetical protein
MTRISDGCVGSYFVASAVESNYGDRPAEARNKALHSSWLRTSEGSESGISRAGSPQ